MGKQGTQPRAGTLMALATWAGLDPRDYAPQIEFDPDAAPRSKASRTNLQLTRAIRAFFENNENEELTLEQMAAKFGVSVGSVRNAIAILKRHGFLCRHIVYRMDK
jgi:DNA-directed RNA polymerase specialized sigma24 family protein